MLSRSTLLSRSLLPLSRSPLLLLKPSSSSSSILRFIPTTRLRPYSSSSSSTHSSSSSTNHSSSPPPPPPPEPDTSSLSLTQRLKLLFKTHGWTALTLYLLLSALDFSLTFLLVYSIGAERVREAEDWVLDRLKWRRNHHHHSIQGDTEEGQPGMVRKKVEEWKQHRRDQRQVQQAERERIEQQPIEYDPSRGGKVSGGVNKPEGYSAYATTAVLAYAIHKTVLLPVRVGLTVAITPKFVRLLRSWGWKVGQTPATVATAASGASTNVTK